MGNCWGAADLQLICAYFPGPALKKALWNGGASTRDTHTWQIHTNITFEPYVNITHLHARSVKQYLAGEQAWIRFPSGGAANPQGEQHSWRHHSNPLSDPWKGRESSQEMEGY